MGYRCSTSSGECPASACASSAKCPRHPGRSDLDVLSQRYERCSILVTTNLPFDEWTAVFGSKRLTAPLLDRLTTTCISWK